VLFNTPHNNRFKIADEVSETILSGVYKDFNITAEIIFFLGNSVKEKLFCNLECFTLKVHVDLHACLPAEFLRACLQSS
jgi:hypothetical protein